MSFLSYNVDSLLSTSKAEAAQTMARKAVSALNIYTNSLHLTNQTRKRSIIQQDFLLWKAYKIGAFRTSPI